MKGLSTIVLVSVFTVFGATAAMATEEAKYSVVKTEGAFELRDYASHILAETVVEGDINDASNKAFGRLFGREKKQE